MGVGDGQSQKPFAECSTQGFFFAVEITAQLSDFGLQFGLLCSSYTRCACGLFSQNYSDFRLRRTFLSHTRDASIFKSIPSKSGWTGHTGKKSCLREKLSQLCLLHTRFSKLFYLLKPGNAKSAAPRTAFMTLPFRMVLSRPSYLLRCASHDSVTCWLWDKATPEKLCGLASAY